VNEQLVGELVRMNFYEARHFVNLVQKSGAVPNLTSWLGEWQSLERAYYKSITRSTGLPVGASQRGALTTAFRGALVDEMTRLVELAN